ncbi:MAG: hypothetical protein M1819_005692 [Sarea resinae]|nr:MAG: hypothetical protein M1819_005692 [Sarea resinae]
MARGLGPFLQSDGAPQSSKGPAECPPSTVAAQIVKNLSSADGRAQTADRDSFKQLLLEILEAEDGSSENGAIETDINVNHKLVQVVARAGLDMLPPDDLLPNVDNSKSQITSSLAVIDLTIRRTPQVLFHSPAGESEANGEPYQKLYVWLLPRLFALVGQSNNQEVNEKLQGLFISIISATCRSADMWQCCVELTQYYMTCLDELLGSLRESRAFTQGVLLPSSGFLTTLIAGSSRTVALAEGCQTTAKVPAQAILIALYLVSALSNLGGPHLTETLWSLTGENDQSWVLDRLAETWTLFNLCPLHSSHHNQYERLLTAFLQLLNFLVSPSVTASLSLLQAYKAANLIASLLNDVLHCFPASLSLETQREVCVVLIHVLRSCQISETFQRAASGRLLPGIERLIIEEAQFGEFSHDLQLAINLLLREGFSSNISQRINPFDEDGDKKMLFADETLQTLLIRLGIDERDAPGDGQSRAPKRRRLCQDYAASTNSNLSSELIGEFYSLLGLGPRKSSTMEGLSQVIL